MSKEEMKNAMSRYNSYRKHQSAPQMTLDMLKKQIEKLHDQEFIMTVPFGGADSGR